MAALLRSYAHRLDDDDVFGLAAELAYRLMFALFPFAIFVAALSGFIARWLGVDDPSGQIVDALGRNLPSDLVHPIHGQLHQVLSHTEPELLSVGALITLYASAGGMNALMKAMNRSYECCESRPFAYRLALAAVLTVVAGVAILVSFVAIVGGTLVTQQFVESYGWQGVWPALAFLRWPLVLLVLVGAVAALLHFGPSFRPAWRWSFVGSLAFSLVWVVMTYGLGVYVARFASFDATYGALAGVMILMLWFYVSSLALICSSELVALLVRSNALPASTTADA